MPVKRASVYILQCADDTLYIGTARDVLKRLAVHNAKKGAKYTKPRLPVRVVYQEGPMTLTKALRREYQLKQLTRREKTALIAGELVVPALRVRKSKAKSRAASSSRKRSAVRTVSKR